jgi:hypothetical protein
VGPRDRAGSGEFWGEERGFLGGGRFGAWREAEEALKPPSFPVVFPDGVYWMVVVPRCLLDGISSKVFCSLYRGYSVQMEVFISSGRRDRSSLCALQKVAPVQGKK